MNFRKITILLTLFVLFILLSPVMANEVNSTDISIDDGNFYNYFDDSGFLKESTNSTILLGNLSNKDLIIDRPVNITSINSNSLLINTTIKILDDGSGSTISNLKFNNHVGSEFKPAIYFDESSNNKVENNIIDISYDNNSYYSIIGFYAVGECLNNIIAFNTINITKNGKFSSKHYIYGIEITTTNVGSMSIALGNPAHNIIRGNNIELNSDYYTSGIYLSCTRDSIVDHNILFLQSSVFVYGICVEYFSGGGGKSYDIIINDNIVYAYSSMIYVIQLFDVYNVNITNNKLYGYGNACYGIAGYDCSHHIIKNNVIDINGTDISKVGNNVDAISTGHAGIIYIKNSFDIIIDDNSVYSYYALGGDYAIRTTDSYISVTNSRLTSNINKYHGNNAIYQYFTGIGGSTGFHHNNTYYYISNDTVDYTIVNVEVFVSINGNDFYGNGSKSNPFLSINKALIYLKNIVYQNNEKSIKINGIIRISNGTFTSLNQNIRFSIIDMDLEIIGDYYNSTFLDGQSSYWFFDISKTSTVTFKNITFINGMCRQGNFGLINNNGNLFLDNCIFINSKIHDTSAIINNKGVLVINSCILNVTSNKGYGIYNKGILDLGKNIIEVTNGVPIYNDGFIDNLVLTFLYDFPDNTMFLNSSKLIIKASILDTNNNPICGGNITFYVQGKEFSKTSNVIDGYASLEIITSLIGSLKVSGKYSGSYTNTIVNIGYIKSSIKSDGLFFYLDEVNGKSEGDGSFESPFLSFEDILSVGETVDYVTIILLSNITQKLPNLYYENGLTIIGFYNSTKITSNWDLDVNCSVLFKNLIFDGVSLNKKYSNLKIDSCFFINSKNTAITSVFGNLDIINCYFINNFVKAFHSINDRGGAINNALGKLTIINSNFINNNAHYGGAIYNNQSDLYVSNCKFLNNLAFGGFKSDVEYSFGGAISQWLGEEVVISNCLFLNNTANGYGGAFFSYGLSQYKYSNGGWIYVPPSDSMNTFRLYGSVPDSPQFIYFINCTFSDNLAPLGGGAVFIKNNSHTEYIDCTFSDNLAYTYDINLLFNGFVDRDYPLVWPNRYAKNWLYASELDKVGSMLFVQGNYGGAIHDDNLHISNTYFDSNSYESGGKVILPTVIQNNQELGYLSKNDVGVKYASSSNVGQKVLVSDSSLLTSSDSKFLGIQGWQGSYLGESILKDIIETSRPNGGSGVNGGSNGNSESSGGSSSGGGVGSSGGSTSGPINLGIADIIGFLGSSNIISNNGNGINIDELLEALNNGINSNNPHNGSHIEDFDNSEIIEVNGTENNNYNSGVVSNGGTSVSVGVSDNSLTGFKEDDSATNSKVESGSSSNGEYSSASLESENTAYEVIKDTSKNLNATHNEWLASLLIIIFIVLLILGYYKKNGDL